jgi:hypothetical protein
MPDGIPLRDEQAVHSSIIAPEFGKYITTIRNEHQLTRKYGQDCLMHGLDPLLLKDIAREQGNNQ